MKVWLASLCLVAACTSAFAQDAAPAGDPQKEALAAQILQETHVLDSMNAALDAMTPILVAGIKRQSPNLTDDQLKMITGIVGEEMKAGLPKILVINARIYAAHFTLDELKAIEVFYQTPAGQKVIIENPKIMKEVLPLGIAWGRETAQEAMPRILARLRKEGVTL